MNVPRNEKKKRFRKFLEARKRHARKPVGVGATGALVYLDLVCAILVPLLFAAAYALFWVVGVFSILYFWLHILACVALCLWGIVAYREARGYWGYRTHFLFGALVALAVAGGSVWPWGDAQGVRLVVTPPAYTRLPAFDITTATPTAPYAIVGGSVLQLVWESEDAPPSVRFMEREERLKAKSGMDGVLTLPVPLVQSERDHTLVLFRGWQRLGVWSLPVVPDRAPQISLTDEPEITARKTIRFPYKASDDYGVESIIVRIAPTTSSPGVSMEPVEVPLATPAIKDLETASYADLTSLPWTGIPVTIQLVATDGAGHKAWSNSKVVTLPSRAFRNPFARALIEEREKLARQPDGAARDEAANVMAGIARQQGLYRGDPLVLMALRAGAVRLVLNESPQTVDAVCSLLWQVSVRLEEGEIGKARQDLAEAERALTSALLHEASLESIRPALVRVRAAMTQYFESMERERARQPPALQELDWPLATASEMLTPDDLHNRLTIVEEQLVGGDRASARATLAQLQSFIENLRTTPPELTPVQSQMVQQVSALRGLVRGQKGLVEESARLGKEKPKTEKERKARGDALARAVAQQQLLIAALFEMMTQQGLNLTEAQSGAEAMHHALSSLQQKAFVQAQDKQTEALSHLQKSLATITEQMRRSLTAKAP